MRDQLPDRPPEGGDAWDDVLGDLDRIIVPGLTHWQHPSFFAFFPSNASGPSMLGELAAAGLGVQGMSWATSPACTEVETHVMDWMVELLDLPDRFLSSGPGGGVIQDSASSASLVALLAARDRIGTGDEVAYVSTQTHSSLEKGVRVARIPHLRAVAVDERFAMRPDALAAAVADDRAAGLTPAFVCSTVGTTSSMAVDPVAEIGTVAAREGLWHHVDAAMAGVAAVAPELRWVNDGLATADSYVTNAHKWLLTNFDCSLLFLADRAPVLDALSILPAYLRNEASEAGAVIDYRDWQVPLGRRFRSLKLWFVLRHYGAEGLARMVREHVRLAGRPGRPARRRPPLLRRGPGRPRPGLRPPRRRRRRHPGAAGRRERQRPGLPHANRAGRPGRHPHLRGPGPHRGPPRRRPGRPARRAGPAGLTRHAYRGRLEV